jgi:hypothetical protein
VTTADDNGEGLRALFYGLCLHWGIEVRKAGDPSDPSDFAIRCSGAWPVYVVIVPEPADRQAEIAALLYHDNQVLVLDARDLDVLRTSRDREMAVREVDYWIRTGRTSAAAERLRLGIAS